MVLFVFVFHPIYLSLWHAMYSLQAVSYTHLQHQENNAGLAVTAAHLLAQTFSKITDKSIQEGIVETHWPGRSEWIGDNIYLDGAHNPQGIASLKPVSYTHLPIKIFNVSEVPLCEDSPSTAGTNPLANSSRAVAQDVHLVNVTILSFFPSNDKRKSYFDYSYSAQ